MDRNEAIEKARDPEARFLKYSVPDGDCVRWVGRVRTDGYGEISLGGPRRTRKFVGAHRFAWARKHGPVSTGMHVLHTCDHKWCVNVEHLYVGTHQDNMRDLRERGPWPGRSGESNARAVLTADAVRKIRGERARGAKWTELAKLFGVGETTVRKAGTGESWKSV